MKGNAIRNDVMPEIWNEAENEMTREMRLRGAWGAVMPQEARIHAWTPEEPASDTGGTWKPVPDLGAPSGSF